MRHTEIIGDSLKGSSVLVTGGTGTIGSAVVEKLLNNSAVKKIIIFSRDEFKQHELRQSLPNDDRLRWFLGDIRDLERLELAIFGVTHVIHAAALKQVDAGEYNPMEFIKTNINGTANLLKAAMEGGVKKFIAVSTDKASSPTSLYGATKLTADKLVISSNNYSNPRGMYSSVVRFGNIVGSRGSLIPKINILLSHRKSIPITNLEMTRFWMKKEVASEFILDAFEIMQGGELFVPEIPSLSLGTLVAELAPNSKVEVVGLRSGEKMHEQMISDEESLRTVYLGDKFVVLPEGVPYKLENLKLIPNPLPNGVAYKSETNHLWISPGEVRKFFEFP